MEWSDGYNGDSSMEVEVPETSGETEGEWDIDSSVFGIICSDDMIEDMACEMMRG